jgi:anti-sigma factor RsiW
MNTKCYDIGIIQAFLDGELSSDLAAKVTNHIAACDACALALAEAEEESAVVFAALENEFNTLVPTQRLWNRINDSIIVEKQQVSFFGKIWAFLAANLGSPSFAVAATVLIVFGMFAAYWGLRTSQQISNVPAVAVNSPSVANLPQPVVEPSQDKRFESKTTVAAVAPRTSDTVAEVRKDNRRGYQVVNAIQPVTPKAAVNNAGYLPGEESYMKTIASLSQSVSGQKDALMRPSERVSYERDMAVVNDSIKRMRDEVRKNPKNESAKQVLYSSYQNKIDLLNSVAQKEELVASLK